MARLVTPGRTQRSVSTDNAIVAAKDKSDRSRNGALDQGELSTQHYGKQLGYMSTYGIASEVLG